MPPRLKPSDYAKGKITQDEIIALQIANDKNIANARKAVKMGEPATLLESQEKTPEELLVDDAKQEDDLRKNLEKLGLRPQEAIATISAIRNDGEIILQDLNLNFPSLEADIKKRFNPKLITPTFLVEYFKKYSVELEGALGFKVFNPNNAGLNANINNIAELRAIIPDPAVIEYIRRAAQEGRIVGQEMLRDLDRLRDLLPTARDLQALQNLDPIRQQRIIDDLLVQFADMPNEAQIRQLAGLINADAVDRNQFRREIIAIIDAIPRGRQENIVNAELNLGGVREIIREELARLPAGVGRRADDGSSMVQGSMAGVEEMFDPEALAQQMREEERQLQRQEADRQVALDFLEAEKQFAMGLRMGQIQAKQLKDGTNLYIDVASGQAIRSPNFGALTKGQQEAILAMKPRGQVDLGELSSMTGTTAESKETLASSISLDTATLAEMKATLKAHPDLAGALRDLRDGSQVNYNDLVKTEGAERGRKVWWEHTNLRDLFRGKFGRGIKGIGNHLAQPFSKVEGQGVANRYRYLGQGVNPEPRPRVIVGRGIAVKETPSYKQYGKYAIHIPQLEQQDMLNVKYKSLGQIPKFKPMAVSDIFRDFILDLLETGKPNVRVYHQVSPQERKVFEEMSIGAGVWNGLGLKRTTTSTDEEENKRFELLKGEYLAGNNNPKVISELRRLVVKMMSDGRIRKAQGLELLMELSI